MIFSQSPVFVAMLIAAKVYADAAKTKLIWEGTLPFLSSIVDSNRQERADSIHLPHSIELMPSIHQFALELVKNQASSNKVEGTVPIHELIFFHLEENQQKEQVAFCIVELVLYDDHQTEKSSKSFDKCLSLKIERAMKYRIDGNEAFQKNQYILALKLYQRGLQWLQIAEDINIKNVPSFQEVEIPIRINMATCFWKMKTYSKCIFECTQILSIDPDHIKALYRRSQAYLTQKEFDLAIEDLQKAVSLEEEPNLIKTSLEKARTLRNEHQKKQQKAFARMFK
jgi:tetratricopeptide (TPR) repeat protein